MEIQFYIELASELLLLFIPGYVTVELREKFRLERKAEKFDIALHSILYSFVIGIVYSVIVRIITWPFPAAENGLMQETVKQLMYLVLAVLLGLFLVKIPETRVGKRILRFFNKNLTSEPSVWIKAMKNEEGAWATVYINNGLIYTGKLINYTTDSNDTDKEILLLNYRVAVRNETATKAEDFCTILTDYTRDSDAKVYLNRSVIVAIELHK